METSSPGPSKIRYYGGGSGGYAVAFAAVIGVIGGGSSLAEHSFALTASIVLGAAVVGWLGYWVLSGSYYFISDTSAGFKDVFRAREVQFDELRSVTKATHRDSASLIFECRTCTVSMPFDPMDQSWFLDLKAGLVKRGIPISSTFYGFPVKEERTYSKPDDSTDD